MKKLNIVIWRENLYASENANFHQPLCLLDGSQHLSRVLLIQKNCQIKAGQNNKYDVTMTSGLVQAWIQWVGWWGVEPIWSDILTSLHFDEKKSNFISQH
jgi:hypothetical protein